MHIKELIPGPTERMFGVGQSGSGKTYLMKEILPHLEQVVVLDPKCTLGAEKNKKKGLEGYALIRDPKKLTNCREPKIQIRLDPRQQTPKVWDAVFWWVYRRQNTFLVNDETYLVLDGNKPTLGHRACITSGRERGIGMLQLCQRPSTIPVIIRSESTKFAVFFLGHEDDRRTMYGHCPKYQILNPIEHEHAFYFYDEVSRDFRYAKL
jgi:hypothetical protein